MSFFKKKEKSSAENQSKQKSTQEQEKLSEDILINLKKMEDSFSYPKNNALRIRNLHLTHERKSITLLYINGAADTRLIDRTIISPILNMDGQNQENTDFIFSLMTNVLVSSNITKITTYYEMTTNLLNGFTIILIDQEPIAIAVNTVGFQNRAIPEPMTETDIVGPKVAFIESAETNKSLLRKIIRNANLICETVNIGLDHPQEVSVMYIKDIADDKIVKNVKEKLQQIESEIILTNTQVEQFIERSSYSLIPSVLMTERPDRASSFLLEGHVAIIMENSPTALIVPTTFWSYFHTVEDQFLRMPYGNFIRMIRLLSLFIALLVPALYIAVTTFHPEMIPTDLMLSIAATRERIPFPAFLEYLIMGASFEILREAGIRIPNTLGPTIGIVGALILGTAAVEANIISPILVVIVAITGLASFTIPDVSLNIAVRMLQFIFLFLAFYLGLYGIGLGLFILFGYLVTYTSFGVPFFAPISPHFRSSKDTLTRPPIWKQWIRPLSLSPKDPYRKANPKKEQKKR